MTADAYTKNPSTAGASAVGPETHHVIRDYFGKEVGKHYRRYYLKGGKRMKKMWWEPTGIDPTTCLYGLDRLKTTKHQKVILVEGEPSVDFLRPIAALCGCEVVGTVSGAQSVPSESVLAYLRPFEVIVWADNDPDGKGQKHMGAVANRLQRLGMNPREITWTDAPPKGDAQSWVDAGGDVARLQQLLAAASEIQDQVEERFPRADLGEVARKGIPPREMLVPNLLYKGRAHTLHGPSGDGKTMIAQAACVLLVKNGMRVVYLDEENGEDEITKRFLGLGLTADQLDEFVFCLSITEPQMKDAPSLVDRVVQFDPSLVVFDSAADFYVAAELDENATVDMVKWSKAFTQRLAREFGIASLLLEHENAAGEENRARGSTGKKQKADATWHVKTVREFDQARMGEVEFKRTKDRYGTLPKFRTAKVGGDGKGHIFFDLDNPQLTLQQTQQAAQQKRQSMYQQIDQKLDSAGAVSADTGLTKNVLRDSLTGDTTTIGQYIEDAAADPTTTIHKGWGKAANGHRATVYWVEKRVV